MWRIKGPEKSRKGERRQQLAQKKGALHCACIGGRPSSERDKKRDPRRREEREKKERTGGEGRNNALLRVPPEQ